MPKKLWMIIALPILLNLSGCATRTIASPYCAKEAPPRPAMLVPAPDPLLFQKCLEEAKAKGPTSPPSLTPSCQQLKDWTSSTLTTKAAAPVKETPNAVQ